MNKSTRTWPTWRQRSDTKAASTSSTRILSIYQMLLREWAHTILMKKSRTWRWTRPPISFGSTSTRKKARRWRKEGRLNLRQAHIRPSHSATIPSTALWPQTNSKRRRTTNLSSMVSARTPNSSTPDRARRRSSRHDPLPAPIIWSWNGKARTWSCEATTGSGLAPWAETKVFTIDVHNNSTNQPSYFFRLYNLFDFNSRHMTFL